MKRVISLLMIVLILSISVFTFADTNTTETNNEVGEETEVDSGSQDKLDTMKKKSNTEKLIDYEPQKSGEDKTFDEGIDNLTNSIRVLFEQFKEIWSEFSLFIVMALSMFSVLTYFMFKLLGVKSGMKASLTMAILPILLFIIYNIVGPFLTTLA